MSRNERGEPLTARQVEAVQALIDSRGDMVAAAESMTYTDWKSGERRRRSATVKTMYNHMQSVRNRLGVDNSLAAVLECHRRGLVTIPGPTSPTSAIKPRLLTVPITPGSPFPAQVIVRRGRPDLLEGHELEEAYEDRVYWPAVGQ